MLYNLHHLCTLGLVTLRGVNHFSGDPYAFVLVVSAFVLV